MPQSHTQSILHRTIEYDAVSRRLWIAGQRCHHGATGTLLAGCAMLASSVGSVKPRAGMIAAVSGALLMVHDWKDRSMWFRPGHGSEH
jgi:hypothetical protein